MFEKRRQIRYFCLLGYLAGTYVHMQDAYVVDQMKKGNFAAIGYEKPTSSVFTYGETGNDWYADAAGKLDKCGTSGDKWTIDVTCENCSSATYTVSDNCQAFTPNFKYIGSSK